MKKYHWNVILGLAVLLAFVATGQAQQAAYIGFVYPAGGQQGAIFQVTLGGQGLEGVSNAFVSGTGVKARVVEYNRKMGSQEMGVLNEQLKELKPAPPQKPEASVTNLIARIEKIVRDHVDQPAKASIANLVTVEITIAPDARPGEREIRLGTPRGLSNPLIFYIGQLPEVTAPPAPISPLQVLGREEQSLRRKKRAPEKQGGQEMMMTMMKMDGVGSQSNLDDDEACIELPCTLNGQISSGAVDRFRFEALAGQRLVIIVQARRLIPYMADAVPGWFQPVLVLCDAKGKEVAYSGGYRFNPEPVILYEVPEDGIYFLAIHDALYRGREDFVYRITAGELPFVTGIFPLGGRVDAPATVALKGWNLLESGLAPDTTGLAPGVYPLTARGENDFLSNPMPFAMDTLPECLENEPNNTPATAQKVTLPVIINGRIDSPNDRDVFRFEGRAGDVVVAEVNARRLESPLDSVLKLTDAAGKCLALNDDHENIGSGLITHHADSYLRVTLPTNGVFYVHLGDAAHGGSAEHAYRLRISAPQSDFSLLVVPSSASIRSNATASLTVYASRQDGFAGTIKFNLKGETNGFELRGGNLSGTQELARINLKTSLSETKEPVNLVIEGWATNAGQKIVRTAVPAEDRMQAFLWRHLVPAKELKAFVFNPPPPPPPPPKPEPPKQTNAPAISKTEPPKQTNATPISTTEPAKQTNAPAISITVPSKQTNAPPISTTEPPKQTNAPAASKP